MDLKYIKEQKELIEEVKSDYDLAHGLEDQLYIDFIRFIAREAPDNFSRMARQVLKTLDIDFPRYTA